MWGEDNDDDIGSSCSHIQAGVVASLFFSYCLPLHQPSSFFLFHTSYHTSIMVVNNDYATEPIRDEEKHGPTYIEHASNSPTEHESLDLTKTKTLEGIDVQNRGAYMGDDSDGKVTWGLRQILAAIFLAGLYTGEHPLQYIALRRYLTKVSGLASHPLLHRRFSRLHRRRSRDLERLSMAPNRQHSSHRCRMPLCRLPPGSVRKAVHCPFRCLLYLHRLSSYGHDTLLCPGPSWHVHFGNRSRYWRAYWSCWVGNSRMPRFDAH